MKPFLLITALLLAGCASGGDSAQVIADLLSASENPDNPNNEIVCVRGGIKGTFTQTDLSYLKIVYPKGTEAPTC